MQQKMNCPGGSWNRANYVQGVFPPKFNKCLGGAVAEHIQGRSRQKGVETS